MQDQRLGIEEIMRGMIGDNHAVETALCLVVALLDQAGICSVPQFADILEAYGARLSQAGEPSDGFARLVESLRAGWAQPQAKLCLAVDNQGHGQAGANSWR
jgi:hypothetical protein